MIMNKIKAAFFSNSPSNVDYVFANGRREIIDGLTDLHPEVITCDNFTDDLELLSQIQVIFSTWGMLELKQEQLELMPKLKAVFYAAGATDYFVRPFLDRKILVCSSWRENAVPVAEFTVSQIALACKGYFQNLASYRSAIEKQDFSDIHLGDGIYNTKVFLLGDGAIANKTKQLLEDNLKLDVVMVSSREHLREISFEEAFKEGYVISNHLPNREDNKKVFNRELFELMPHGATFINTGRGAQVDENDLAEVFKERPDLVALLDVTYPEPPVENSPLLECPNVFLTSHIAGSLNKEVVRMADSAIDEFKRYASGEDCLHAVREEILITSKV